MFGLTLLQIYYITIALAWASVVVHEFADRKEGVPLPEKGTAWFLLMWVVTPLLNLIIVLSLICRVSMKLKFDPHWLFLQFGGDRRD